MSVRVRRVVTGHDAEGRSVIVFDDRQSGRESGDGLARRTAIEAWATVLTEAPSGAGTRPGGLRGTELRIVEMPPGSQREMHRTDTIDYGIVLAGEIHLVVETGETLLRAGDVVVQRGTMHSWHNRTSNPARMAFINMVRQTTDRARCPDV